MIADEAVATVEKVVGGVAALAASFYLVERAIRFNVDITDRYKDEIERLQSRVTEQETKIRALEQRENDHLTKIAVLEQQVHHLQGIVDQMRIEPPARLPPPPTSRTRQQRKPKG